MNVLDEIPEEAFAIYEEFGPNRSIPRKDRLHDTFPQLAPEEIELVLEQMRRVSATVSDLAERGGETQLGTTLVTRTLQINHPFLRGRGLSHAVFLVNYYAWHDGYDQSPLR